ncbi:MAG: DUF4405 domain-containing protein [Verrucomicrobiales bacterium]
MKDAKRPNPQLGTLRRRLVSLLTALTFLVLAVTGVFAFSQPFDIGIIGLHSLMGFLFILLIALHVFNNSRPLVSYLRSKALWVTLATTVTLTALFWWQPAPVKTILGWSGNLGPAMEMFEMREDVMVFHYTPSPEYKMRLTVQTGPSYRTTPPPHVAIWLENQGAYHIKTLLEPSDPGETPYWAFKRAGWEKAKREAERLGEIDAVSSPTPNGSFDPADYILPKAAKDSTPYQLLLEINQTGDEQSSLVYAVEIDNALPRTFQLLELRGYPKREEPKSDGKETWGLFYVDETFTTALDLIDSALLTIERGK